jgi:biotin carboxylase/acetyl-CoA carboxylase carboxyltransferase component
MNTPALRRLLIINNSMSCLKFLLSILEHKEKYNLHIIGLVTDDDMISGYQYINYLDETIHAERGIYTNQEKLCGYIQQYNIHMVWPGWGYLSENHEFVKKIEDLGVIWVGPSSETIFAVGDKIQSMIVAEQNDVPIVRWSGKKPVENIAEAVEKARDIGFPLIIKSSSGGGGKGLRTAHRIEEIPAAFLQVQAEIPNSDIFLMALAVNCRHLEVQLVGDGVNVMNLGTRDCSVQRRNQKLIEEAPASIAPPDVLKEMEAAACRIAKAVRYKGLGTAEFIYQPDKNELSFLEINPRLQVEHVVTEILFNKLNLPLLQIRLALDETLDQIFQDSKPQPHGHVIAVRINAENPFDKFTPSPGVINNIDYRTQPHCWAYFSVHSRSQILPFFDGQFGHIFSWGETRDIAIERMHLLLSCINIDGEIFHTKDFLRQIVVHPDFVQERHHTQWLATVRNIKISSINPYILTMCAAIVQSRKDYEEKLLKYLTLIQNGHLPDKSALPLYYTKLMTFEDMDYEYTIYHVPDSEIIVVKFYDQLFEIKIKHIRSAYYVNLGNIIYPVIFINETAIGLKIRVQNETYFFPKKDDPSVLNSSITGRFIRYIVDNNSYITKGEAYAEIEVMKMILPLLSTHSGRIKYTAQPGPIQAGEQIAKLASDDSSSTTLMNTKAQNTILSITKSLTTTEDLEKLFVMYREDKENEIRSKHVIKNVCKTSSLQNKNELLCQKNNTTYCHYFPEMFKPVEYFELEVEDDLVREVRSNRTTRPIAMVAWQIVLRSLQTIVVIANDITVDLGTFSYPEEHFFTEISKYCRKHKYPRVYIACNSGAKLHFRDNLMERVKIMLNEKNEVSYLYLEEEDYRVYQSVVDVTPLVDRKYKLNYVLNYGTKNLDGSGMIASETVRCYDEIFTISYVTGRSVGLGAYIQKLGERIVQKVDSPMILTGFNALNNVLGKNVYHSNLELGGPAVMGPNGNSHLLCQTDQEGIDLIVRWLSFAIPEIPVSLKYKQNFEVRQDTTTDDIIRNIFDDFMEMQSLFARSVIVGRGRLNGRGVGIIAANNQLSIREIPLEPNDHNSTIRHENCSGSVWYPDSSKKTARAIQDIEREGLPIILIANFRGFSGGTTDMFVNILEEGSEIVRALESVTVPVCIWLPAYSQLRGGAFVVLSKSINPSKIHIVADKDCRINILEPTAIEPIKIKSHVVNKLVSEQNISKDIVRNAMLRFAEMHDKPEVALHHKTIDEIIYEQFKTKETLLKYI